MNVLSVARRLGPAAFHQILSDLPDETVGAAGAAVRGVRDEVDHLLSLFDRGFAEGLGITSALDLSPLHRHVERIYAERVERLYATSGERLETLLLRTEKFARQLGAITGRLVAAGMTQPGTSGSLSLTQAFDVARNLFGLQPGQRRRTAAGTEPDSCPLCI